MSEPVKKTNTAPESYSPKAKPEILDMVEDARQIERLTQTINYKGVEFEVVRRPDVIWVGCVDYADNNTDESNIGATLKRFQGLVGPAPIKEKINPDWSAALSINYTCSDKPCGIMFANESYTDKQDEQYDIFMQPGGLWLRVRGDDRNAKALLGKETADLYEFFGALRNAAKENGYVQNPDVHVEVEYHCHAEYNTPPHTCYAYIPVIQSPESYFPKNKPEIINVAGEMMENERNQEIVIEPLVISKSFSLVGVESAIDFGSDFEPVLNKLRNTVVDSFNMIVGVVKPARMIGFWHMAALPSGEQEYRYFAGVEATCEVPPDGLITKKLPESLYAVFSEQKRGQMGGYGGYAYKWLRASSYEENHNIPGDFEVFKNMTDTGPECEAEIYVPIKTPESYSPKNKPEILKMMEQNSDAMSDIITGLLSGGEPPMLTGIRELLDGMKGHNYELPDCLKFIFERIGAYENISFWDIAALAGDTAAQVYNRNITTSCSYSVSAYLAGREHIDYMFDAFGYGYEYVTAEQFNADTAFYLRKTIEYIRSGIPVLVKTNLNDIPSWHSDVGTYCLIVGVGYENEKVVLKLLVCDTVPINHELTGTDKIDLIFIGEKQREVTIEEIYSKAMNKMSYWLTLPEHDGMFFGAAAYRAWADDIENERFTDKNIPLWENYGVYVVNLATSGGGAPAYICLKLAETNPRYTRLSFLKEKILKLTPTESSDGSGRCLLWIQLDELGGGMDMNAVRETMRDKEKRSKVAAALRDYANRLDKVVELLKEEIPESYSPKNKPEILNMMETVIKNELQYPPQYRIKSKGETAVYTGAGWPHSNAYPAMFTAISLFYGKETRLNEKGEQINDDLQYRIQGALSTEAYGIQYSELFEGDHLQNCLGIYGIKPQVVDCSDWAEAQVRDFVCAAIASDKTVIIEPKEYKDMHLVFGYGENGKTLFCCPFLDGDDKKNCSFNFQKYYKRKNRTAHLKRLIVLEETSEKLNPKEVYRQSLNHALEMMSKPSPNMDFMKLRGAGIGIYDAWIALLKQANAENSEVFYMHFPVFPQFIILYENRLHFCEFLKVCAETYGELPELMELIEKCEEVRDLAFEDAEIGFHRENGDPKYHTMTNNERRNLLIGVLEKCREIDKEITTLLKKFARCYDMSELIKKPKHTPESFSPKNKPEILRMAEENAGKSEMKKAYQVKTANGGSYIDGVPVLRWGEWKDCTYSGAVALLLNVMGINATYEQIAGLTGSCYRFGMCYGWDPGSLIVNTDYYHLGFGGACGTDYNANRVYGLNFYGIADEEERNKKVQNSIDAGIPVLCMGGFGAPEWCVLTGYEKTEEGVKYFGRSYFDGDATEEELLIDNKYSFFKGYPGEYPEGFLKLCDKSCEASSPLEALKVSLETCLKMFSPHEKIGYGAYELAINSMKTNKYPYGDDIREYNSWNVCMHFSILLDARRAAYIYLEESAGLLSGENKTRLMNVSAMYREMFNVLSSVLPYDKLNRHKFDSGFSAEHRRDIADALRKMVSLEKQVRDIVQEILDTWKGSK